MTDTTDARQCLERLALLVRPDADVHAMGTYALDALVGDTLQAWRPAEQHGLLPLEGVMRAFVLMGQQSLAPDQYEALMEICRWLSVTRGASLRPDSLERVLDSLLRDEDRAEALTVADPSAWFPVTMLTADMVTAHAGRWEWLEAGEGGPNVVQLRVDGGRIHWSHEGRDWHDFDPSIGDLIRHAAEQADAPDHWRSTPPTVEDVRAWSGVDDEGNQRAWQLDRQSERAWQLDRQSERAYLLLAVIDDAIMGWYVRTHSCFVAPDDSQKWWRWRGLPDTAGDRIRAVLVTPSGEIRPMPWPRDRDRWQSHPPTEAQRARWPGEAWEWDPGPQWPANLWSPRMYLPEAFEEFWQPGDRCRPRGE